MTASLPLSGKRIVVTRARPQAGGLADALAAQGAEPLLAPAIAIAPPSSYASLDAAINSLSTFDWLVLTSANAAAALAARLQSLGAGIPMELRVAAIGPATAEAAREMGLNVEVTPKEYVAEAVIEALKDDVSGKRVLLVRAAVARDVIPFELTKLGAKVEAAEAYQTVLPEDSIRDLRRIAAEDPAPDAVTFTSSSTVRNFLALWDAAGLDFAPAWPAISIGPVTTRTLRERAWADITEAVEATVAGVVEACIHRFANRGGTKFRDGKPWPHG